MMSKIYFQCAIFAQKTAIILYKGLYVKVKSDVQNIMMFPESSSKE